MTWCQQCGISSEVAKELRDALEDALGWVGVYDDHMSPHHFDERDKAAARARAAIEAYDREQESNG